MAKNKTKTEKKKTKAKAADNGMSKGSTKAAEMANGVEAARSAAATSADFVSRNVIPLGMVAAGLGILAARNINDGDNAVTTEAARCRKRLALAAKQGRGKAAKGAGKLRKRAGDGVVRSKQTVSDHPVAAGVAAAAVGAGLAVAVPKLMNRGRS